MFPPLTTLMLSGLSPGGRRWQVELEILSWYIDQEVIVKGIHDCRGFLQTLRDEKGLKGKPHCYFTQGKWSLVWAPPPLLLGPRPSDQPSRITSVWLWFRKLLQTSGNTSGLLMACDISSSLTPLNPLLCLMIMASVVAALCVYTLKNKQHNKTQGFSLTAHKLLDTEQTLHNNSATVWTIHLW